MGDKTMSDLNNKDLIAEQIASAEELIPEETAEVLGSKTSSFFRSTGLPLLLALTAALFFGMGMIHYPQVTAAFTKDPPLHQGGYGADRQTDQCVANLWRISRLLQEGKPIPANLLCPAGGRPYIQQGDSIVCPNPQAHKQNLLKVSRRNPVPEVQ
jgi:hypothetical protein